MALASPVGGTDFPRNLVEMTTWFSTQEDCLDYLEWLRWPDGIECHRCASAEGWYTGRGDWMCSVCKTRTSITAGTVFERSRVELPQWFALAWHMTSEKTTGISAAGAQRLLELGSYQTAWTMSHKLRSAMVRPGRDLLRGDVEVDETYVGGKKPGKRGKGAAGKKIVAVAIELLSPKGFGRARLQVVPDDKAVTLNRFISDTIEPGSLVITDGLQQYAGISRLGYTHNSINLKKTGIPGHVALPGVHRVAALLKRSLLNSYQSYPQMHLQAYCDEWAFRFNRRSSRHRGQLFLRLLENAVECPPLPYSKITMSQQPRRISPTLTGNSGVVRHPVVNEEERPWRP